MFLFSLDQFIEFSFVFQAVLAFEKCVRENEDAVEAREKKKRLEEKEAERKKKLEVWF